MPAAVREILAVPQRQSHGRAADGSVQLLAHDRSRMVRRQQANRRRLGDPSRGHDAAGACGRAIIRATRTFSSAAIFLSPGRPRRSRRARFLESTAARRAAESSDIRQMAHRSQCADHGPGSRQSHLAIVFRHGLGGDAGRFRLAERAAVAPKLLDWLAVEFMDGGWSLKKLHRLIVTSATYRQSSRVSPELRESRSVQSAAGSRAAFSSRRGDGSRRYVGGQRLVERSNRRSEHASAAAGVPIHAAGQLRAEALGRR